MKHYMPVKLFTGEGCIAGNAPALARLGKKAMIVCSPSAAKKSGALDDALSALCGQGIGCSIFDEITPNPSVNLCIRAGEAARRAGADFIFGIGGGSAMDAAKAIAVFASNEGLDEDGFYQKHWNAQPLPIALAGTTAGTGSEVTMVSVLTDKAARKHSIHDERLYAAIAFGDPRYLPFMTQALTASTGIDALSHCIESYFSKKADALSRLHAVQGARLILKPLARALDGALGKKDFSDLYLGSILGGLAINTTGTCFPHNLGYYLTERFQLPHGAASAAFLGDLLAFEETASPDLTKTLYESLNTDGQALSDLKDRAIDLKGIALGADELEAILPRWQDNSSVKNTLGDIDINRIRKILSKFIREV